MDSISKLLFYTIWSVTGINACFYLKEGFSLSGSNPVHINQWLSIASMVSIYLLYRAYHIAEDEGRYKAALGWVVLSWLPWALVTGIILLFFKNA
ncbi:MAG: hypothetical protein WCR52_21880 [Bacteroidota bacterium]